MAILNIPTGDPLALSRVAEFFNRPTATARLSDYARGGGVVPEWPFFDGFGFFWNNPTRNTLPDDNDNDVLWPTEVPDSIVGFQNWTYTANTSVTVAQATNVTNSFINNNPGVTYGFSTDSTARMDITVSNNQVGETPEGNFILRKINADGSYPAGGASANSIRVQNQSLSIGRQTITMTGTSSFTIAPTEGFRFYVVEGSSANTPYDIQIHSFLVSSTTTLLAPINESISSDGSTISLSSLRGVNDGDL